MTGRTVPQVNSRRLVFKALGLLWGLSVIAQAVAVAPDAVDVYAAILKRTPGDMQLAIVILEGSDADTLAEAITYSIVSSPGQGTLSDPDNGDVVIGTEPISGRRVLYTPAVDFTGEAVFDQTGGSVVLSSDGRTVAIGSPRYDPQREGGSFGRVRLYRWDGNTWRQLGVDIDGEAAFEESGESLALASDGQIVAIGAAGAGDGAGQGPTIAGQGDRSTGPILTALAVNFVSDLLPVIATPG